MEFEILNPGSGFNSIDGVTNIVCPQINPACPNGICINAFCSEPPPQTDKLCGCTGLGCRVGCGGAAASNCSEPSKS